MNANEANLKSLQYRRMLMFCCINTQTYIGNNHLDVSFQEVAENGIELLELGYVLELLDHGWRVHW